MPYAIHNTVRSLHHRTVRAQGPQHPRFVQRVDGRRILRARRIILSDSDFERCLGEIRAKAALGHIEVRTVDGRRVDPNSLSVGTPLLSPPRPAPPLDSIARDKPWGEKVPSHQGDYDDVGGEPEVPTLVRSAAEEAEDAESSDAGRHRGGRRGKR